MRILTAVLVALIVLIQYPLWFGKGGWLRVRHRDGQAGYVRVTQVWGA